LKRLALFHFFISLFAASSLLGSDTSQSEAPAVVRLTLDDALERARASSARLTSLDALTRAAAQGVRGAEALRRPELDLQASYTRNSNVPELILSFPGAAPGTIFPNLPNNWRSRVGATLPIYTGGGVQGQISAASESERAAASDRAAAQSDLVAETHVAYVTVLFARENARVLKDAVASYEAHLKDVRNRLDLGLVASHEVLSVVVERERAELFRVQSENAAQTAVANLLRLVGLPAATPVELDTTLIGLAGAAASVPEDEAVKRAATGRPELEALRARIRAMEASARVAHSASRPQAGLTAGYDFANPNPKILPLSGDWNDTWSIGVSVNWKVLDGGRANASVARAEAQADALRAQLQDLESRIRLEVTTRRLELDSALAGQVVARRGIEAAKDAVRVSKDRYREGVLSSSELLDAETRLLRAELEATQTEAQIHVAMANLTRAVGR
jgi:outer membrane protein TolC